jgi:oligopeptide transport system substrate-binding protein
LASFILSTARKLREGKKPITELGVKALDKYTLEIKTPFPVGFMPSLVSNLQFGPVHKATSKSSAKTGPSRATW